MTEDLTITSSANAYTPNNGLLKLFRKKCLSRKTNAILKIINLSLDDFKYGFGF